MLKDILYAIGVIFILLGIFFVLYIIVRKALTPKGTGSFFALVPGTSDDERLPEKVYAAFIQANLLTFWEHNEVIVLDMGVSDKVKEQCRNIMSAKGEVVFCKADEIGGQILFS